MSSLTDVEKRYFEKLLDMQGGYVSDFSDATFGEFFSRHGVEIHGTKYQTYGTSKAKKMRAFWEREPDTLVGTVLSELLDSYEADCDLNNRAADAAILEKSRGIVARLSGKAAPAKPTQTVDDFLHHEFTVPNIQKLPIEALAVPIVEGRLAEARTALGAGAYLSVIFLCGSVLEAVLLGAAQKEPARFNQAGSRSRLLKRVRITQTARLGPFDPRAVVMSLFDRAKGGIVIEPPSILSSEKSKLLGRRRI